VHNVVDVAHILSRKGRHDVLFLRDWTGRITFEEVNHLLHQWSRSVLKCIKSLPLYRNYRTSALAFSYKRVGVRHSVRSSLSMITGGERAGSPGDCW